MTQTLEIVIVSGKGGTGKTSIAGALASLMTDKIVADCDVDAANLHMILQPEEVLQTKEFVGGKKAKIDLEKCTKCGLCRDLCRFDAIGGDYIVDVISCEGCGVCYYLCPVQAVEFSPRLSGYSYVCSTSSNGVFVFAELLPGEENSGKLVAMVRNEAREEAKKAGSKYVLIDGPPGIGCPVISSVTGTHLAIVVTEPTPTGIHDMERIVELTRHFKIKTAMVINKWDVSPPHTDKIKRYCAEKDIQFLGEIPYETAITKAQKEAKTILEYAPGSDASVAIRKIYARLKNILEEI